MSKRSLLAWIIIIVFSTLGISQHASFPIASKVKQNEAAFKSLKKQGVLQPTAAFAAKKAIVEQDVSQVTYFKMNESKVESVIQSQKEFMVLDLATDEGKAMDLKLFKAEVFSPDFRVVTASNPNQSFPIDKGAYYWGIINDDQNSLAAISFSEREIMGFLSYEGHNYTLGKLEDDADGTHILYKEADMLIQPNFACGTDESIHTIGTPEGITAQKSGSSNCVKMYVEADYDIFVGKGGVAQASNYIIGLFSQVAILYANEAVNFNLNELKVWDVEDPYTGSSTSGYLDQFRNQLNGNFNGDLAHLVGYQGNGGIAYLDVLCFPSYAVGYSDINASYANVPTYSWSVEVLTHEIGHNIGSPHTHACSWGPNGDQPIDCCGYNAGYVENNCGADYNCTIPNPVKGTIMSYCHLLSGIGIDFNLGFGQEPGDLIRNRVYNKTCLSACSMPDDAGITAVTEPSGTLCVDSINPIVTLQNFGSNDLAAVTIEYYLNTGGSYSYSWTGNLTSGASTTVTLPTINFLPGHHVLTVSTANPNGVIDTDDLNDAGSSTFQRATPQTYYADTDGDGYGDATNTISDCSIPGGYVMNSNDCNDSDASAYPGAACSDGDDCTEGDVMDNNCNCISGQLTADTDGDGFCDAIDICQGGDDSLDENGNGIPDFCDCNEQIKAFPQNPLIHAGAGSNATTLLFGSGDKDVSFTIYDMNGRTKGSPRTRFIELVEVTYVDGDGTTHLYGRYDGSLVTTANIDIPGAIQSVTISLSDGYGSNLGMSIQMTDVVYCLGCSDVDGDGVCDDNDVCAGFDDTLIGTPCDDGDPCTINDVYSCGPCAGTPTADSDADGVCDGLDVCPGEDDTLDADGDGTPDACDDFNCADEVNSSFATNGLIHSGSGSNSTSVLFPSGNVGANFTINDLNAVTSGKPSRRYIEQVTITYQDSDGNVSTYGTFTGDTQNSVNVSISGSVQEVTVSLSDAYDGDAGTSMSVSLSDILSCMGSSTTFQNQPKTTSYGEANLFPNPAFSEVFLKFDATPSEATVIFHDLVGKQIGYFEFKEQRAMRFDLNQMNYTGQILFVTIQTPNELPVTKKLLVNR